MRNGKIVLIKESELVVGDICFLSPGENVLADGRLISDESLFVDESALTGESVAVRKNSEKVLDKNTCLDYLFIKALVFFAKLVCSKI